MDLRKPFVGSLKIILDSKKPDICPTLSEDQARQVPPKLLKELFRDFSPDDLGDLGTLVQVLDKKWHGTLTKMVQWIRKGEAADFLNEKEPYVRRPDRRSAVPFEPMVHANEAVCRTTQETHDAFAEHLALYVFSICYEIKKLQSILARKLCSYPAYTREIGLLMSKLYSTGNETTQHVDPNLALFLANRIKRFRKTLLADKTFLAHLRACIPRRVEFDLLLKHPNLDKAKALQSLRNAFSEQEIATTLLKKFEAEHLTTSTTIPKPRPPNPDPPAVERPKAIVDAMRILNAVYQENRLVRADRDIMCTLRCSNGKPQATPRNDEYRIARGEYLVLINEPDLRVHGASKHIVCNKYGNVGELADGSEVTLIQDVKFRFAVPPKSPGEALDKRRVSFPM